MEKEEKIYSQIEISDHNYYDKESVQLFLIKLHT